MTVATTNATIRAPRLSPLRFALLVLSVVACAVYWVFLFGSGQPSDGISWYYPEYGRTGFEYIWSPAFAQLTTPLRLLPFEVAVGIMRGLELACLVVLAPFGAFVAVFLPPVAAEVNSGNINLILTLCVVAGLRWPALWTLPLLTKPSMGLGLLWFLARKEWRSFAIAVIPAAAISAVSFVAYPQIWFDWLGAFATYSDTPGWPFPIPVWPRIPIAVVLVIWGARTNRPWTVMAATFIAWPRLYFQSLAILVGLIPLLGLSTWIRTGGRSWLDPLPAWISRGAPWARREGSETQAGTATG